MKTRLAAGALAAVTAIAVVAIVAIFNTPVGISQPQTTESAAARPKAGTVAATLTDVIPAHPVTAITTPAGATWWAFVTDMAPMLDLQGIDLGKSGIPTTGYAYSTSVVRTAEVAKDLPLYAAAYIQTTSVENADALISWLAAQPGSQSRRAYRSGLTVIIGPEWADKTEFTLDTTSTTAALTAKASKPSTTATWLWDLGQWRTETIKRAKSAQAKKSVAATLSALGVTDTTVIRANTKSPAQPWAGAVTGYSTKDVNVSNLVLALASSDKVISQRTPVEGTTFALLQTGLGGFDRTGGVSVFKGTTAVQSYGQTVPSNLLPDAATSVAARIDTHMIGDYALGYTTENPGPAAVTFQVDPDGHVALTPSFGAKK